MARGETRRVPAGESEGVAEKKGVKGGGGEQGEKEESKGRRRKEKEEEEDTGGFVRGRRGRGREGGC